MTAKKQKPADLATVAPATATIATEGAATDAGTGSPDSAAALAALEQLERETTANDTAVAQQAETIQQAGAQAQAAAIGPDPEVMAAARIQAMAGVGMLAGAIETRYPFVTIAPDARNSVADALAPVLVKHGAGMPEWLIPYKEEFALFVALGGTAFGVYLQVQAHKEQLAREAQQRAEAEKARGQGAAAIHGHPGPAPVPPVQSRPAVDLTTAPAVPAHLQAEL